MSGNRNLDRQIPTPVQKKPDSRREIAERIVTRVDELNEAPFLVSRRDIKTQYGVQIWWKNPVKAGVTDPAERLFPRINWFDTEGQADGFTERFHPKYPAHGVAKISRHIRTAIEIYGAPELTEEVTPWT